MGFCSFDQQNKLTTMDVNHQYDTEEDEEFDSFSAESSCDDVSSDSDQEVNSQKVNEDGAFGDMSSLAQQLPSKTGLSKHFKGKSQSFTSLASVLCVEDLAKPENPYNKKMKSCRSYGGLMLLSQSGNKNGKKGSCSSLMNARRNNMSFLGNGNRPPPPHRSASTNNFSTQTHLVA